MVCPNYGITKRELLTVTLHSCVLFQFVNVHLNFLQFILQEGALYLLWSRSRDIWDTLVANPDACAWDRDICFEWFRTGIADLEPDTQSQLFQKEILRLELSKVSNKGCHGNCIGALCYGIILLLTDRLLLYTVEPFLIDHPIDHKNVVSKICLW